MPTIQPIVAVAALFSLSFFTTNLSAQQPRAQKEFVICYNPQMPPQRFAPYRVVVVDYAYPPAAVAALRKQGKTVIGYLSLGKVHKQRLFAAEVARLGLVHSEDADFPGTVRVHAGNPKWQELVVTRIVPHMKTLGFDGIFLDDLDDLGNRKLQKQTVQLIKQIRKKHPEMKLMANRGLEYLADFAAFVDYSLLESCFALNGKLRKRADPDWAVGLLKQGQAANPKLQGVAIDYIPRTNKPLTPAQRQVVAQIRMLHREQGLWSCVSTEDLQSVPQF